MILECCGCERVYFRRDYWFSEWDTIVDHPVSGQPMLQHGVETVYWPSVIARRRPKWLDVLRDRDKSLGLPWPGRMPMRRLDRSSSPFGAVFGLESCVSQAASQALRFSRQPLHPLHARVPLDGRHRHGHDGRTARPDGRDGTGDSRSACPPIQIVRSIQILPSPEMIGDR